MALPKILWFHPAANKWSTGEDLAAWEEGLNRDLSSATIPWSMFLEVGNAGSTRPTSLTGGRCWLYWNR